MCPSEQNNACRAPVVIRPPGILFMTLRLVLMSLQRSTTHRAAIQPQQKTITRPPRALSVLSEQSTVLRPTHTPFASQSRGARHGPVKHHKLTANGTVACRSTRVLGLGPRMAYTRCGAQKPAVAAALAFLAEYAFFFARRPSKLGASWAPSEPPGGYTRDGCRENEPSGPCSKRMNHNESKRL